MRRILLSIALSAMMAAPAGAQQLKLAFNQGRVSVDATSVPVRTILAEWGKLGGTKVVGGDRVAGAPLTLKLVDVPEAQALEIILRSTAGYMAAPRASANGASMYDRILVLATSSAPAPAAARPGPTGPGPTSGTQRFVPPRLAPPTPADEDQADEDEPAQPNQPVFTFPPPGQSGMAFPGNPQINVNPNTGAPQNIVINPSAPGTTPATTGFGSVGAPTPGMIQQPTPPTSQPPQPGPMTRPPG